MKLGIVIICLFPVALGFILDSILDVNEIHNLVNAVVERYGDNATEQECERECLRLFTSDILDKGCDFACLGIQNLINSLKT